MGKKKSFIDKQKSSTFHLLHRSQRDVAGDGSGVVLWPGPENNQKTNEKVLQGQTDHLDNKLDQWKDQLADVGLVDEYDYEKHMKPITGSGDFFGKDGHRVDGLNDARAQQLEENVQEVPRQLDSIAVTPDCMDDDIAQALFGNFEEGDFEEILDDFCLTAAEEPEDEEEEVFDFDKHVQNLIEQARLKKEEKGIDAQQHEWGRQDKNFFSKSKALSQRDDDDDSGDFDYDEDDTPGVVPVLNPDEEKALCEKFEQTLLEYDSDEIGELEEEEIGGERPLEGDTQLEAALDDYLEVKEDDNFIEGTSHLPEYNRGGGFHTIQREGEPEKIDDVIQEANDFLRSPELVLPPEEILIDGKSYFSQASRNPWDCESVLSTYSNVDNNPAVIDSGRRRGRKKKSKATPEAVPEEDEPVQILLSNKTGLPLGVLPSKQKEDDFDFDTIASVNKGEKRGKDESKAQKKNRKQLVKQERQIARIQKKMMREAFRDEFMKREGDVVSDDIAGKSVFRF